MTKTTIETLTDSQINKLRDIAEHETASVVVGAAVEGGVGEDADSGRVIAIDGDVVTVAWSSGVRTSMTTAEAAEVLA